MGENKLVLGGVAVLLLLVGVAEGQRVLADGEECLNGAEFAPHPNCTLYYICTPAPVLSSCPPGLFFNFLIASCDFPANVPECVGGTRPPTGTTPTTTPTTTTPTTTTTQRTTTTPTTTTRTTITTITTTTRPTNPTETPETEGTPTTTRLTTLPNPAQCDATGIHKLKHPDRCDAYFWCINGDLLPEVHVCPAGLLFDPQLRECNFETDVECDTKPPTTTPPSTEFPECAPGEVSVHPYPGNCTLYIICVDGAMTFYKCPEGMLFDAQVKECRPENVAVCASAVHEEPMTTSLEEETLLLSVSKGFYSARTFWRRIFNGWTT